MMRIAALCAVVASANAAVFKWNKNNLFSNGDNWEGGAMPSGAVNLADCPTVEGFGSGAVLAVDVSVDVGSLTLPMNGGIELDDGVELSISGETETSGSWRCKSSLEINTACSNNYLMYDDSGNWVQADTAPCLEDEIWIPAATAASVSFHAGQHVDGVSLVEGDSVVRKFTSTDELESFVESAEHVIGSLTVGRTDRDGCGGNLGCALRCQDICPAITLPAAIEDKWAFFDLPVETRDKILEEVRREQDALNVVRNAVFDDFGNNAAKVAAAAQQFQEEYIAELGADSLGEVQDEASLFYDQITVWTSSMADVMEATNIGTQHEINYLGHAMSKADAERTLQLFGSILEEGNLNDDLWNLIDADGKVRGQNRLRRANYNSVKAFIIADVNRNFPTFTGSPLQLVDFDGPTAVAAYEGSDFDEATGAFLLKNVKITGFNRQAILADGAPQQPVIHPELIGAMVSYTLSRMALYAEASRLADLLANRPTTTFSPTVSPSASPTVSPTTSTPTVSPTASPVEADFLEANLIPVAAGGGGGLLIILIIIIVSLTVCTGSKGDKAQSDMNREAVAFENPMYDDPARAQDDSDQASGLYDEPTFQGGDDKENPMYQSQEGVDDGAAPVEGGGYLDVEPDDEDDDDEDDDEDNDDEDDE